MVEMLTPPSQSLRRQPLFRCQSQPSIKFEGRRTSPLRRQYRSQKPRDAFMRAILFNNSRREAILRRFVFAAWRLSGPVILKFPFP